MSTVRDSIGGTLSVVHGTRHNRGVRCSSLGGRLRAARVRTRVPGRCFITSRVTGRPSDRRGFIIVMESGRGGDTSIMLPTKTSLRIGGRISNVDGRHVRRTLRGRNFRSIGFCGPSNTLNCRPSSDCFTKGSVAITELGG